MSSDVKSLLVAIRDSAAFIIGSTEPESIFRSAAVRIALSADTALNLLSIEQLVKTGEEEEVTGAVNGTGDTEDSVLWIEGQDDQEE